MSGFAGLAVPAGVFLDEGTFQRLSAAIAFRGSHPTRTWSTRSAGLAYAHLDTGRSADPSSQPATLDGSRWITGDILLCNRADLFENLRGAGIDLPRDTPDAMLVLHSYRAWGEACARYLMGEFAFAIVDIESNSVFCARDHFGVRPFFYALPAGALVFSNALRAVLAHPGVARDVNEVAVGDFLIAGFNLSADTTAFSAVRRLPPAHTMDWRNGVATVRRYYDIPLNGHVRYARNRDYVEHFLEIFGRAVADRVESEKSISFRFSGGMDSTSLAAMTREVAPGVALQGFTMHAERVMPEDHEHEFARAAADYLEMPLQLLNQDETPLFGALHGTPNADLHDDTLMDGQLDLYRRMRAHASVAIGGDTGDHLFLPPYTFFTDALRRGNIAGFVGGAASYIRRFGAPPPLGVSTWLRKARGYKAHDWTPPWINAGFAARLRLDERYDAAMTPLTAHPLRPYAHRILASPIQASAVFERDDVFASAARVEARHPFTDKRLVEYMLAIPGTPWMFHKLLLREAMRGRLPEMVRTRKKTPLPEYLAAAVLRDRGADYSFVADTPDIGRFIDVAAHPARIDAGMAYKHYYPVLHTAGVSLARWLNREFAS